MGDALTERNRPSVVIAEPDAQTGTAARRAIEEDGGMTVQAVVADRAHLIAAVRTQRPDAVVIDAAAAPAAEAELVREVLAIAPGTVVIVTTANPSTSALSRAVVAGARGFLLKPYQPEDLLATVRQALATAKTLRDASREDGAVRPDRGVIVTAYSPKGGAGTTTIATNLAVALATRAKARVALIDLDLQFGDVGVALDLSHASSITDLLEHGDDIDEALIEDVFARHSSGVRALLAPEGLTAAEGVDPVRVSKILSRLRDHFDYVICDTWSTLDELSVVALSSADRVLLVTTPEVPALRSVQRVLNEIPALRSESRSLLVLNRYPSRVALDIREIERGLGRPVSASIPSRGLQVVRATNQGIVSLGTTMESGIGPSIYGLADTLIRDVAGQRGVAVVRPSANLA